MKWNICIIIMLAVSAYSDDLSNAEPHDTKCSIQIFEIEVSTNSPSVTWYSKTTLPSVDAVKALDDSTTKKYDFPLILTDVKSSSTVTNIESNSSIEITINDLDQVSGTVSIEVLINKKYPTEYKTVIEDGKETTTPVFSGAKFETNEPHNIQLNSWFGFIMGPRGPREPLIFENGIIRQYIIKVIPPKSEK